MTTTTRNLLHLSEVGLGDVSTVGGKGASLGELLRAGIQVPTGFSVTTAAFRQVVGHLTADDGSGARSRCPFASPPSTTPTPTPWRA